MQFIPENIINEKIALYEANDEIFARDFQQMVEHNNPILSFFQQESLELLTESEKVLLEFMFTVIYSSIHEHIKSHTTVNIQSLEDAEEKNWEIFNDNSSKNFTQICDIFFENYPQEDLLAFVEDTLQLDEEEPVITTVGREIILIACKSFIDTLIKSLD